MATKIKRVLVVISVFDDSGAIQHYALWSKNRKKFIQQPAILLKYWIGLSLPEVVRKVGICPCGDIAWAVYECQWFKHNLTEAVFSFWKYNKKDFEFCRLEQLAYSAKLKSCLAT